jgi:preprotein translocase subunit SecD
MNRYPKWKYILLIILIVFGVIYALPNIFGDVPALQISSAERGVVVNEATTQQVTGVLSKASLTSQSMEIKNESLFATFSDIDVQAKAQEVVKDALGDDYTVALYLQPATPGWLSAFGAKPMRLGLDLRGGVHFLLAVDVDAVFKHLATADVKSIAQDLRDKKIRYAGMMPYHTDDEQGLKISFRDAAQRDSALSLLQKNYSDYQWAKDIDDTQYVLQAIMGEAQYQQIRQTTIEQSMTILRNRVNELGISEAVVTQQGADQIAVDLPGIQDVAQAQNIIGKTATLEFHLVDTQADAQRAAMTGVVPAGDQLEYGNEQRPYLLKDDIILQGSSVTNATANYGDQGPEVGIKLAGGSAVTKFNKITAQNVGQPLAVLYVETRPVMREVNGKSVTTYKTEKRVINSATINSALGNSFRITGLDSIQEAGTLALLLRAGALPVPINIIQEQTIGPSLGQQNISKGMLSVEIGFLLVVLFMIVYYRWFGVFADLALVLNLLLIVAVMSILGAVMTLPGIAGIVLTVGMAVDANVLIFERIREELRNGITVQAAIHTGYGRALTTIVDANVTTLIVAIVLFSLGSGAVKGFAITLTIGLITSMITSIFGTRAIVNLVYGNRNVKNLSIGIKHKEKKSILNKSAANS